MNVVEALSKPQVNSEQNNNKRKVTAASITGSALGISCAVAGIYASAKKGNPSVSLRNLKYAEKDALIIGAGSVLGGLTGGIISDKENIKPKLREASQQFFGNMVFPIGLLALSSKILEKSNFKLPKINSNSIPADIINRISKSLPQVVITMSAIAGGMEIGNKVMNKVNDKIFKEESKHDIKPEDYLMHADDICLAANMLLNKTDTISKITSKILPLSFIIAGSKTGMQQEK